MTKNRKKMMSKVIASGMLLSNIPIQTFANEIEDIILDSSTIEEKINNTEIHNSNIEYKIETVDSNELENQNIIGEDSKNDYQLLEEISKIEESNLLDVEDSKKTITTKDVVDNKYIINTIDDLKQLRTEINTNHLDTTDMIVELGADIDFTDETSWESIGQGGNVFKGTFDGKNYTIKNLNITGNFNGLFGNVHTSTFQNINFDNININSDSSSNVGIISAQVINGINVNNINFKNVSLIANNAYYVGVISANSYPVGKSYVSNVSFDGNISGEKGYVGGLFGIGAGDFSQIEIKGTIVGYQYVGGIVGILSSDITDISEIKNVKINASLESIYESASMVGGIIGFSQSALTINNIRIEGDYIHTQSNNSMVGGIIGLMVDSSNLQENSILDCIVNTKEIEGGDVGGIIGFLSSSSKLNIESNEVYSDIKGMYNAGGIGGKITTISSIKNNVILNNTLSGENSVGGVVGTISSQSSDEQIENNTVKSTIFGGDKSGGLIGVGDFRSKEYSINNNDINVTILGKNYIGGLGGYIIGGNIKNNKIISNITANDAVGGIVGSTMQQITSYSKNTVSTNIIANNKVGGAIGSAYDIQINNNFIEGTISGKSQVGGLMGDVVGTENTKSIVNDCILIITVTGESFINSIIGKLDGVIDIENIYYNIDLTEVRDDYGTGLTTFQMQGKEAQENMNLDFTSVWKLNKEYYPTFEQINTAPEIIVNSDVKDNTIVINQYDKFNILDYIAVEDFEGDEVTVTIKETVDTSKYGVYPTTIVATDSKGLSSEHTLNLKINPLQVVINNVPTIIAEDKVITVKDKFNPLSMIVAYDKEDGIITNDIKIVKNTVNLEKAGIYEITYEVKDKDGAKTTKTIKVTVKDKAVSNNNQNNLNATDKVDDKTTTDKTDKPQTSDVGLIGGISGLLVSTIGLASINIRKKD